jgi:hypothetical protein
MMVILILLVRRIGFGVTGLELAGVMMTVQGCYPVRCWKHVVSYHTQIYGPIYGATTHENSATMSLYRYDLAQYVMGFTLGIPTSCAEKL